MTDAAPRISKDIIPVPEPLFFLDRNQKRPQRNPISKLLEAFSLTRAPEAADWRKDGYTGPVRSQGTCQSCTAHATAAMYEAWSRRYNQPASVAGPFLHKCVGGVDCAQGLDPVRLMKRAVGRVAPPWVNSDPWPGAQCAIANGFRLLKLREIVDEADAKSTLAGKSPVVASLEISANFYKLDSEIYIPDGPAVGDHAICLVGFGPEGWIAQNSFGPGWGAGKGFFQLGYGVGNILRPGFSAIAIS